MERSADACRSIFQLPGAVKRALCDLRPMGELVKAEQAGRVWKSRDDLDVLRFVTCAELTNAG